MSAVQGPILTPMARIRAPPVVVCGWSFIVIMKRFLGFVQKRSLVLCAPVDTSFPRWARDLHVSKAAPGLGADDADARDTMMSPVLS